MDSKTYETGFFKKLDAVLYYIGEFLLAVMLFYPVIAVAKGVLSDPGARESELGHFLRFSPEFLALSVFMAFTYTIVFSKLHFKYIFIICAAVFLGIGGIVLGLGFWPLFLGPVAAVLLLWLAAKKVVLVHNFFVDGFNYFVKSMRPYEESIENLDSIFSDGPGAEKKNGHYPVSPAGKRADYELNRLLAVMIAFAFICLLAALSVGGIWLLAAAFN